MTGCTKRCEIFQPIRFYQRGKGAEGSLVMHVMLTRGFECSTYLTLVSVTSTDALADTSPFGAIVIRVIGPGSCLAQTRHSLFGEGKPIACCLQITGRQVQRLLSKIFMCIP